MNYSTFFIECVNKVLGIEKYVSDDQRDLGNKGGHITIWGICSKYHPKAKEWLRLSKRESREKAIAVYHKDYWKPTATKISDIPNVKHTAYILFDSAVQFQPRDAKRMLQRAINKVITGDKLVVDGIIGKFTLSALENISMEKLNWAYKAIRLFKHLQTISRNPSQACMARGWGKRTMGL